jgi:hypothetical protein
MARTKNPETKGAITTAEFQGKVTPPYFKRQRSKIEDKST